MVWQKETLPTGAGRSSVAQKLRKRNRHSDRDHDRDRDRTFTRTTGLVARPTLPKSKHKTIFEWTENTEKKKKLEIEFTTKKNPNANFSFVPIGNPELSSLCKELSREQGALVYIVSTTKEKGTDLSDHVHRIGFHFRTHIVEQATTMLEGAQPLDLISLDVPLTKSGTKPDPIPESQEEINKQADAAIRDLFPRIPNTDREMIVRHAFQKGAVFNGKPVVGLQADLTLSRRVQLAVIAHIRHTHTRYDLLLRETSWESARRTVESLCLDILVKWRGDEETGRDQLDEVLREIVVIDDSDEDSDEESEGSESEDEEEDSSDDIVNGVADVNLEHVQAHTTPHMSGQNPQLAQSMQVEARGKLQGNNQVNNSKQIQGIASRTRSKAKQNHRQKVKKSRRNKRFQAWQDAVKRRIERPSAPKTPFEQTSKADVRGLDASPRPILNRTPVGQSNLELYTAPVNYNYQTIYAIDNNRVPRRTFMHLNSPRRTTGPANFNYREKQPVSSTKNDAQSLELKHGYDLQPPPSRLMPFYNSGPQENHIQSRKTLPIEDMALPSIESATDLTSEGSAQVKSYGPMRQAQVMYQQVEPERRVLQAHTNTTYVSNWDSNQPKRRRVMLADDQVYDPASLSVTNEYVRVMPFSRSEQATTMAPSMRRVVEFRDGRERRDVPTLSDQGLGYPRYIHRAGDAREQNLLPPTTDVGGLDANNRERHITVDDSPPRVRVVRRALRPSQLYSGEQYISEPVPSDGQRVANQHYIEQPRPPNPMKDPLWENKWQIDPNQSVQSTLYARTRPTYQHELAQSSSTSFSDFPHHPHSREVNSGLVSYPILSRPYHDHNSRFPTSRDEPIMVGTNTSHQVPQESLAVDNLERFRPQGIEENRRPFASEQVSRTERRYVPMDSQVRMHQTEAHYIPIDPSDMARRVVRDRPTHTSSIEEPTYIRKLPYRDEVIVLGP